MKFFRTILFLIALTVIMFIALDEYGNCQSTATLSGVIDVRAAEYVQLSWVPAPFVQAPLQIVSPTTLPTIVQSQAYQAQLLAQGGVPPYTWSIASGALPTGLSLASSTGLITGTTSVSPANFNFTIKVVDSTGVAAPAGQQFTYNVYRSFTTGGPYTQIATGVKLQTYYDFGVISGTSEFYVITEVDAVTGVESGFSSEVTAAIP